MAVITEALLKRQPVRHRDWDVYESATQKILGLTTEELTSMSANELIARYQNDKPGTDKLELAAVNMLRLAQESADNILLTSKLRQNGLQLLKYLQQHADSYSLQRAYLISLIEMNG